MRASRRWLWFAAITIVALAVDLAYLSYRQRSLEPLTVSVDLTRAGRHTFPSWGYHASTYYPSFRLRLAEPPDARWDFGPHFEKLWGHTPPEVHIVVVDGAGHRVLDEHSSLTREEGWIVTGAPQQTTVEVYKFAKFRARMFGSYRVTPEVLAPGSQAHSLGSEFAIHTIKSYELFPVTFVFLGLIALIVMSALALFIADILDRNNAPNASAN